MFCPEPPRARPPPSAWGSALWSVTPQPQENRLASGHGGALTSRNVRAADLPAAALAGPLPLTASPATPWWGLPLLAHRPGKGPATPAPSLSLHGGQPPAWILCTVRAGTVGSRLHLTSSVLPGDPQASGWAAASRGLSALTAPGMQAAARAGTPAVGHVTFTCHLGVPRVALVGLHSLWLLVVLSSETSLLKSLSPLLLPSNAGAVPLNTASGVTLAMC